MPNNNLRHTYEMHQSLTRDKITHTAKECSMLKRSSSATTNPNRAPEAIVSDYKSLIRNKPTSLFSNTKSDHQNKKGIADSNEHGLVDAHDDDEEKKMLFCKKS